MLARLHQKRTVSSGAPARTHAGTCPWVDGIAWLCGATGTRPVVPSVLPAPCFAILNFPASKGTALKRPSRALHVLTDHPARMRQPAMFQARQHALCRTCIAKSA